MGFSDKERRNIDTKVLQGSVFDANSAGVWFESRLSAGKMVDSRQVLAQVAELEAAPAANVTEARAYAAGSLTGIIQDRSLDAQAVHLTVVPGTNGSTYVARETYGDQSSARIKNWIQPQMIPQASGAASIGYAVRLFNGDPNGSGTEVLTTDGTTGVGIDKSVGWIWNYDNGELILSEDFKASVPDPYVMGFNYIGETGGGSGSGTCSDQSKVFEVSGSNLTDGQYIKTDFIFFANDAFVKVYENGVLLVRGSRWSWGSVKIGRVGDLIDSVAITSPIASATYRLEYTEKLCPSFPQIKLTRTDGLTARNKAITNRCNSTFGMSNVPQLLWNINSFDYYDMKYNVEYRKPNGEPYTAVTIEKNFGNHLMIKGKDISASLSPWRIEVFKTGKRSGGGTYITVSQNQSLVPYVVSNINDIRIYGLDWANRGRNFFVRLRNTSTNEVTNFSLRYIKVMRIALWRLADDGDESLGYYVRTKMS